MTLTLMRHTDDVPSLFEVGDQLEVVDVCPQGSLVCTRADGTRDAVWPEETNLDRVAGPESSIVLRLRLLGEA